MFEFEKEGNVREGALTQKKLNYKIDNIPMFLKVIKIRKNIDFSSQIHTYFHELSHLVNEHEIKKNNNSLSYSQKEYVAEVCAQALLYSFVGGSKISDLPSNNKWDRSNYIYSWIRNARMSDKKIDEMWKQINFAYNKISDSILKNINN